MTDMPPRFSQTLLGRADNCLKSAELQVKYRDLTGHERMRGQAFHDVAERMANEALAEGETRFPADMAKAVLAEVVADHPEWTIPAHEMDALRAMCWNVAEHMDFTDVTGVEWPVHWDVDGDIVSGRIDLVRRRGRVLIVEDYKTSLAIASQEQVQKGFQGHTYAVLAMNGVHKDTDEPLETKGVEEIWFREIYPRYTDEQGLVTRTAVLPLDRVIDHGQHLRLLVAKLKKAWEDGVFPAVPGSHCATCQAPAECPIPASLRGWQGAAREIDDLASVWHVKKLEVDALWKELRAYASEFGEIPFGTDLKLAFTASTRREVDRDALMEAARYAAAYGEEFDPDEFVKVSTSTQFRKVKR